MTIIEIEQLVWTLFSSYLVIQIVRIGLIVGVFLYFKKRMDK